MKNILSLSIFCLIFVWNLPAQKRNQPSMKEEQSNTAAKIFNNIGLRNIVPAKVSGRVVDIAVDPHNRSVRYVATASGNVWKTMNAGTTWKPIFERYGSYSAGVIEIDPNHRHVLWLGTGENNAQRSVGFGDGIYKSTNSGESWTKMGLEESEHIGRIVIDPRDSEVIYVAAQGPVWKDGGDRGLYKSTDGGKNWTRILHVSEQTGISDIIMDPRNPDILLASSYQRRRHFGMLVAGGPDGGIWKSTDAGQNWTKLSRGLPSGDIGRIGLAQSPQKPDVLYAVISAVEGQQGIYRSENLGDNWSKMSDYWSTDPQYYMELYPDPHQFDRIYSVDVHIKVSEDGGKTFSNLNTRHKHVDNHEIVFDPHDPNYLMVGCDGGIYESWDRGDNWKFIENLPIVQFYRVGIDMAEPFYHVYGGTQDNATLGGPSRTLHSNGIRNSDWFITRGGDGFQTRVDPHNPNIVYSQSQYAGIVRYDRQTGEKVDIQPQPEAEEGPLRWNWDSPLILSPHAGERLYFAAHKVFKSDDRGNSWTAISPDLTKGLDRNRMEIMGRVWGIDAVRKNLWTSPFGTIVALDESPLEEGLLYVGTDDGLVQISEDGGQNWRKSAALPGLPELAYASDVHASRTDPNTVFALFNMHKYGDFKPYIYKSTDRGRTWTSIAANIPEPEFAWSIYQDHINEDLLFLGTEFGLWFSINGGEEWTKFKKGIPTIPIRDLEIHRREGDLIAASFGRGFFILDDYQWLREISPELLEESHAMFKVKDPWLYVPDNPESRALGASFFTSPNPPFGAVISYYNQESIQSLKQNRQAAEKEKIEAGNPVYYPDWEEMNAENREDKPAIVFSIENEAGEVVRRITGPASMGIHRISWDLRYGWSGQGTGGMLVTPGRYTARMAKVVNGTWIDLGLSQEFQVVPLENSSLAMGKAQEMKNFRAEVDQLHVGMVKLNAELKKGIAESKAVKKFTMANGGVSADLFQQAHQIQNQLQDLEIALNGNEFITHKMELIPPAPARRVDRIRWNINYVRTPPTQTQKDSYAIAKAEYAALLKEFNELVEKQVQPLSAALNKIGSAVDVSVRKL